MTHQPTPTELLTAALATSRLTRLITTDVITDPLRKRLWRRFPPENHGIGFIPTCDFCASIYAAALIAFLNQLAKPPAPPLVRSVATAITATLALSGAVSLLHDYHPPPGDTSGWDS